MLSKQLYSPAPRRLMGKRALFAITVWLLLPAGSALAQSTTPPVVYNFGRPVRADEHTYNWYRSTHANAAAARYGVSASDVGDGMDTWHWWVGVDNPEYWRESTKVTNTAPGNLLGVNADFLKAPKLHSAQ